MKFVSMMSEGDAGCASAARVVVFSGHLFDRVGRPAPRFPVSLAPSAAEAIGAFLDGEDSHSAFCSLSCGADILFAEEAIKRGIALNLVVAVDAARSLAGVEEIAMHLESSNSDSVESWCRRAGAVLKAVGGKRLHELHEVISADEPGLI